MATEIRERCFACDKLLHGKYLVGCKDDQTAYVGSDCFRHIRLSRENGYQPPKGGPRLYLLKFTRFAHSEIAS